MSLEIEERTCGKIVVAVVFTGMTIFSGIMIATGVKTANIDNPKYSDYETELVARAKEIYARKVEQGLDLTNGPCLSDELDGDWVLDIAHDPREAVDELLENECPAYRDGRAEHFIELDEEGKVIKLK
ncbi:MAG: hypothetical protein AAB575_02060 [Patescibacteria group bacterium]